MTDIRMSKSTAEDLIERLTCDFGYGQADARRVTEQLENSDPQIRRAAEKWLEDGFIDDSLSIHGFTGRQLVDEYHLSPAGAFAALDWIRRDPQTAVRVIKRHDRVLPRRP